MTLPVTFSAPGSYEPSIEDRIRDAVYLMMLADLAHARYYAYDEDDLTSGVMIAAGYAHTRNRTFTVPQLLVQCVTENASLELLVQSDARRQYSVAVTHFERPTSAAIEVDILSPAFTPETLIGRTEEILERGTLRFAGQETNRGVIVDPYSPLLDDGTYDPDRMRSLNVLPPAIRRARAIPIKRTLTQEAALKDFAELDPATDIAVLYSVIATYEIEVNDRENARLGGMANG